MFLIEELGMGNGCWLCRSSRCVLICCDQELCWQPRATHAPDLVAVGMQWPTCSLAREC